MLRIANHVGWMEIAAIVLVCHHPHVVEISTKHVARPEKSVVLTQTEHFSVSMKILNVAGMVVHVITMHVWSVWVDRVEINVRNVRDAMVQEIVLVTRVILFAKLAKI